MSEIGGFLDALGKPVAVLTGGLEVCHANRAFASLVAAGLADAGPPLALSGHRTLGPVLTRAAARLRTVGWTVHARWVSSAVEPQVYDLHLTRSEPDRLVLVLDEVTAYLRIEEIQNRARAYLEAVLNHLNVGVIVLDTTYCVTFFNADQQRLFQRLGVDRTLFDLIGAPIAEVYPILEGHEWEAARSRAGRAGEAVSWSKVPFPRQAPESYFDVDLVPLGRAPDGLPGAICVTADCTRTVGLERELVRNERMALVGQMAIALNHEINNPLTAVLGTAESLLSSRSLPPETASRVDTIRVNALRIVEVTRRLRKIEDIHLTEYIQGGPLMVDLQAGAR